MTDDHDTVHSELAPESEDPKRGSASVVHDMSQMTKAGLPATSAAVSAFALELESKLLDHLGQRLDRYHELQIREMRDGQNKLLAQYAKDSSGHRAELSSTINKFTDWAGRSIIDLQEYTHANYKLFVAHVLDNANTEAKHDKAHELFEKRISSIERWRAEVEGAKRASAPPESDDADNPPGR